MSYYVLKKLQNERKFKRKELADLLNVGESDISKRIHGDTIFKDEEKKKVYSYLLKKGIFIGEFNDLFKEDGVKKESKELELSKYDTPFQSGLKKCLLKEKETTKRSKKEICELLGIEYRTLQGYINGKSPKNEWEMILRVSSVFNVTPLFFYDNDKYNSFNQHDLVLDEIKEENFIKELYFLLTSHIFNNFNSSKYNKDIKLETLNECIKESEIFWNNFNTMFVLLDNIILDLERKNNITKTKEWHLKKIQQLNERVDFLEKYSDINNQNEIHRLKNEVDELEIYKDIYI